MSRFFNISAKRRGGISFLRIGRINVSISVARRAPAIDLNRFEMDLNGAIRAINASR